jgi:hypothetical protein
VAKLREIQGAAHEIEKKGCFVSVGYDHQGISDRRPESLRLNPGPCFNTAIVRRGSHGYISIPCRPPLCSNISNKKHIVSHIYTSEILSGTARRLESRERLRDPCTE